MAVAIGTSRTHLGLRPAHAAWPVRPVYNLAFDGATPAEILAYLRHAQAVRPLRLVVLGLDTWQLSGAPSSVRPDFDPSVLLAPDDPRSRVRARLAELRILLSLDTAAQSWATVWAQARPQPAWLAPDGQRLGDVFFRKVETTFVRQGPAAYFTSVDRREIGFKLPEAPPSGPGPRLPAGPTTPRDSFDDITEIIAFCRSHAIDLRVFVTPAHAHQSEIAFLTGEQPVIERGKRRLVAALAQDAIRSGRPAFPLWDFSGYSRVTTEPVPDDPRREMAYYWDSSHFKAGVGDWVLDRVLGADGGPGDAPPTDFGRRLTPESLEPELAAIRAGHETYARAHPADVAQLAAMVNETRAAQSRRP